MDAATNRVDISFRTTGRTAGLVVGTAMAGALLAGCATNAAPRAEVSAAQAAEAMAEGRHDRAVRLAEQAVQAEPRSAAYRATLGKAYLDAGRFASAEATFTDAMMLGDASPRTALSLALALTAQAKYTEAAALLNDWEGQIATADLGLALALAGQPERGVHLMSNAIRGGEDTVKMRQNLAFAYAVAGRWREARVMAAQDLPADQVGTRMEQWAAMASADAYEQRVARLLGVPAGVSDTGQPVHLALSNNPSVDQLAEEATALAAAPAPVSAPVAAPAAAPIRELAALDNTAALAAPVAVPVTARELPSVGSASLAPALEMDRLAARAPAQVSPFAQAFAPEAAAAPAAVPAQAMSPIAPSGRYASLAQAPAVTGEAPAPAAAAMPAPRTAVPGAAAPRAPATRAAAPIPAPEGSLRRTAADGSHLVQLGSFSSEQGARRAWGIYLRRYPELANHEMVITEAVVNGRRYFRVSAGGFDRNASRSMCRRVDAAGGDGCISWAAATPLPGAVDRGVRFARR